MGLHLQVGRKNRSVASTLMNQDSSRSHSVFTITVETADKTDSSAASGDADSPAGIGSNTVRVGKLNLVDLAGSERQSKTGDTAALCCNGSHSVMRILPVHAFIGHKTQECRLGCGCIRCISL